MPSYRAAILGNLWQPGIVASTERSYQAENDGAAILAAETTEAGDFSRVIDVRVTKQDSCGTCDCRTVVVKDWQDEDTECQYCLGE